MTCASGICFSPNILLQQMKGQHKDELISQNLFLKKKKIFKRGLKETSFRKDNFYKVAANPVQLRI